MWKRGEIAPSEQFLLFSTIFCYLLLQYFVKTGTRISLRDKRLFEISVVEITRVDCISGSVFIDFCSVMSFCFILALFCILAVFRYCGLSWIFLYLYYLENMSLICVYEQTHVRFEGRQDEGQTKSTVEFISAKTERN